MSQSCTGLYIIHFLPYSSHYIQKQALLQTSIMIFHEAPRTPDHQYEKPLTPVYRAHVLTCKHKTKSLLIPPTPLKYQQIILRPYFTTNNKTLTHLTPVPHTQESQTYIHKIITQSNKTPKSQTPQEKPSTLQNKPSTTSRQPYPNTSQHYHNHRIPLFLLFILSLVDRKGPSPRQRSSNSTVLR